MGYSPSFYLACAEVCLPRQWRPAISIILPRTLSLACSAPSDPLPRNSCIRPLNQNPSYDYAGEVNALAAAVGNPSLAQASGIKAGGVKYMFIRSHVQDQSADPFLAGNKGGAGISVRQTKAVILVAISAPGAAGALLSSVTISFIFSCANSTVCLSRSDIAPLTLLSSAPCRPFFLCLVSPMRHSAVQGRPVADRRQLLKSQSAVSSLCTPLAERRRPVPSRPMESAIHLQAFCLSCVWASCAKILII